MTTTSITNYREQANREIECAQACEQLHALALYASTGQRDVMARALEVVKPLLPAETIAAIDAILDASAMAGSAWCVSAQERQVA